ncbi:MAG: hypothetical protein ACRDOH_04230 [Streptosporangiaceae bacterium]
MPAGDRTASITGPITGPTTGRPRRRVSFRKGADVDEELWPTAAFGGVSDEQFWDDLASDKPLTTTARTAQQEPGTRNRPLAAVPPTATQPAQKMPPAATQPVQSMPAQVPATQPVRAAAGASRPTSAASQPLGTATQPAETRGRRRASSSADEDPLTSAAFSLRTSGPVDGRSSRRSSVPHSGTSYGDPSSATQAMNTPPYDENYGYDSRGPAAPADDLRQQTGARSHARPDGAGEGTRATRQAYPQDGYQGTGSYPTSGYPAGGPQDNGYQRGSYPTGSPQGSGHQGSGHQGSGHRAPYDPREDYRRLTQRGGEQANSLS